MDPKLKPKYTVRRIENAEAFRSECGMRNALLTIHDNDVISVSRLCITEAPAHYHKRTTEVYYCIAGTGTLTLDGEPFALEPGVCALIEPGCRHATVGDVEILIMGVPPFTPDDMHYD